MEKIFIFIGTFIIVYLVYLITVVLQKRKMEKFKKTGQIMFFIKKYNLDFNVIPVNKFANILSLANSFIMATTLTIVDFVDSFLLKMLVAFIIMIPLMLFVYSLIGKYIKKEGKKNV